MNQSITLSVIFSYAIMFISKGIPIIIGLISLFRLLPPAGVNNSQVSHCLPNLIVILACISMLTMTWSSTLGLAIVCVAIIVMNKLKPDNI